MAFHKTSRLRVLVMHNKCRYSIVSARFSDSEYKCLLKHAEENGFQNLSELMRHSVNFIISSAEPSAKELIAQLDSCVAKLEAEVAHRPQSANSRNQ